MAILLVGNIGAPQLNLAEKAIGILDAGYFRSHKTAACQHAYTEGRISTLLLGRRA